jgi:hypothetical protein
MIMAGEGVANEEIAYRVGVTPNTVRSRRGQFPSKQDRRGRTALSKWLPRRATSAGVDAPRPRPHVPEASEPHEALIPEGGGTVTTSSQ